jgi:hypothetical protein
LSLIRGCLRNSPFLFFALALRFASPKSSPKGTNIRAYTGKCKLLIIKLIKPNENDEKPTLKSQKAHTPRQELSRMLKAKFGYIRSDLK